MTRAQLMVVAIALCGACNDSSTNRVNDGGGGGDSDGGASTDLAGGDGGDGGGDGGSIPPAPVCTPPIARADVSAPTTRLTSCTEAALRAAVTAGGIIVFDCGASPVTITLTQTLTPPLDRDTVIDGGGLLTLDGGEAVRILEMVRNDYRTGGRTLTLQGLRFVHGKAPAGGYVAPSTANPKCAYGYRDGSGGAVLVRDNRLRVIDCVFEDNHAATPGPDVGGGAIYGLASLEVTIVGSSFLRNDGANAGAVGLLQTNASIINSRFESNRALGTGQNYASADTASCPGVGHAGQGGAGGNGGAIAVDGSDNTDLVLCGDVFADNQANELAGALFRTANTAARKTRIDRSLFRGNQGAAAGALYLRNSKPLEIEASTFAMNRAVGAGAAQLDECTLAVLNTTFYGNEATRGLGGAISNFSGTTGTFKNVTFAENRSTAGSGFFSAAIAGQMNFTISNTLFANNLTMDAGSPMTCGFASATMGANDLQWPQVKPVGGANDTPCVTGITFADPQLGALTENGGPTPTARPSSSGPAAGAGRDCPPTDQRGQPRSNASCTIGAVE